MQFSARKGGMILPLVLISSVLFLRKPPVSHQKIGNFIPRAVLHTVLSQEESTSGVGRGGGRNAGV